MLDNLSYLAGLIDGEGSVGFFSSGKNSKRFSIEIKMTDENVIDWLVDTFGGYKQFRPSTNPKWKNQWRWRIQNNKAKSLYENVSQLLKIKVI